MPPYRANSVHRQLTASFFNTDNIYAAIKAAREGVGYAILPYWVIQDDLDTGRLVEICPEWRPPEVILSVAYPPSRYRPVRISAFAARRNSTFENLESNRAKSLVPCNSRF